jgi:hypothetical protein
MAFVINGTKYCLIEIFHAQALVSFYLQFGIMLDHHFIPYALCW